MQRGLHFDSSQRTFQATKSARRLPRINRHAINDVPIMNATETAQQTIGLGAKPLAAKSTPGYSKRRNSTIG
jgi:hypothetical protein